MNNEIISQSKTASNDELIVFFSTIAKLHQFEMSEELIVFWKNYIDLNHITLKQLNDNYMKYALRGGKTFPTVSDLFQEQTLDYLTCITRKAYKQLQDSLDRVQLLLIFDNLALKQAFEDVYGSYHKFRRLELSPNDRRNFILDFGKAYQFNLQHTELLSGECWINYSSGYPQYVYNIGVEDHTQIKEQAFKTINEQIRKLKEQEEAQLKLAYENTEELTEEEELRVARSTKSLMGIE